MHLLAHLALASLLLVGAQHSESPGVSAFPTFPGFDCDTGMAYCNQAKEANLLAVDRYGRGAAFADIDGDGWDDLFLADCDNRWAGEDYGVSAFFLNQRDGTFRYTPATELGIDDWDLAFNWSGSFADYDNDGDPDLLLANGGYSGAGTLALYENRLDQDEGFVSVTVSSRIGSAETMPASWWGSSWADYDNDGWLDVVVTRTKGRALVFHNEGDGTFTEVGAALGRVVHMEDGKNPVWIDYDGDGDPDLYLAGMWQHAFYRNDGGVFVDVTDEVFAEAFPYPRAVNDAPVVFAAAAGDFNQDGVDDLYLGRFELQDVVLLGNRKGGFSQHSTDWGLTTATRSWPDYSVAFENTMGLGVGDLFDDGYPDVLIGTGNPSRAAQDLVFCNKADNSFRRCTDEVTRAGVDEIWRTRSHGTVFSDFDHDGDTDFVINLGGHPGFDAEHGGRISPEWPALFVNQQGPAGHSATVTLEGTSSNRDAIGARIRVDGSRTLHYVIRSMQAFQSQNSRDQTLNLGSKRSARIEITWPSGNAQVLTIHAGDRLVVREP